MFRKLDDFYAAQQSQVEECSKNIVSLTPESLRFKAYEKSRSIGQLVRHIVLTIPEMMSLTGLELGLADDAPVPQDAAAIATAYSEEHAKLAAAIKANWDDATLEQEDEMYGSPWKRGITLANLLGHEIHHFGQLTVMMRLCGLPVHGVMGPSKEEWKQYGMEEPPEPQI